MKICPMGAELFHSDRRMEWQADKTKKSLFANLRKRLKNLTKCTVCRPYSMDSLSVNDVHEAEHLRFSNSPRCQSSASA